MCPTSVAMSQKEEAAYFKTNSTKTHFSWRPGIMRKEKHSNNNLLLTEELIVSEPYTWHNAHLKGRRAYANTKHIPNKEARRVKQKA